MTGVVVDTDVVSFLFKNHPIGVQYDADVADRVLVISFRSLAELDRWVIQSRWGEAGSDFTSSRLLLRRTIAGCARSGPR